MKFKINQDIEIHFIGIGGIGMSAIAEILLSLGFKVSGSDVQESNNTKKLESMGAVIKYEHASQNIKNQNVVVYSSAITPDNLEYQAAIIKKIPIMQRAEMVAELMRLKCGLAVAGTHGKTTTSGMLATILSESGVDPSYLIGGIVQNLKGHAKVGNGDYIVVEADESDGSFLLYNPVMSIINNVDLDHMDYYKTEENLCNAFKKFADRIPFFGLCALNAHDGHLQEIKKQMKKPSVTFGIYEELGFMCDFEARNVQMDVTGIKYDLCHNGEYVGKISLKVHGRHNLINSLGAIAISTHLKIPFEKISSSLEKFTGIGRRFNYLVNSPKLKIIDDYAHHPTAVRSVLETVKTIYPKAKIITLFEPHRYTRTRDSWDQFLHCFKDTDQLFLGPIYSASEKPIEGINSELLNQSINRLYPGLSVYIEDMLELPRYLKLRENEEVVLLALGAGSVSKVIYKIVEKLDKKLE
ncbi:MAG: UDP-N-acetylmuramate--L-alanine ligase [Bdellovibrionales bacterium RIFOXYA1_FULL_36_14]|nr:MAG: UDP-N-acetylmuramate--L-alanine ligase [Bdellovibrionales bacterium RIFOXYA1_FULL_36_14]